MRSDAIAWINALRHKEIPLSAEDEKTLALFRDEDKAEKLLRLRATYDELARIGGARAGEVVIRALRSETPGGRAAAAEACERTLFGKAVVVELAELLEDKSDAARQAAIQALTVAANWRYPEAQMALCRLAAGGKRNVADRSAALQALARAVELPLLGNFEDTAMFWTLVHLLDDEDVRIRRLAFEPLAKAVADGHGYSPEAPASARKEALAKWKTWYTEKTGEKRFD